MIYFVPSDNYAGEDLAYGNLELHRADNAIRKLFFIELGVRVCMLELWVSVGAHKEHTIDDRIFALYTVPREA